MFVLLHLGLLLAGCADVVGPGRLGSFTAGSEAGSVGGSVGDVGGDAIEQAARARFLAEGPEDVGGLEAGRVGDVDGDGYDDLLLASQLSGDDRGVAWLFYGPVPTGDVDLAAADLVFEGTELGDHLGSRVATGLDLTGDGLPDVALAAYRAGGGFFGFAGIVHVFEGARPGSYVGTDAAARLIATVGDMAGSSGIASGDLTGDGWPDLLVSGGQGRDSAWIAAGPFAGDIDLTAQPAMLDPAFVHLGEVGTATGDWSGDGQLDAALAFARGVGDGSGVRVYAGPLTSSRDVDVFDAEILGHDAYACNITNPGDVDADGYDELLFGGPYHDTEVEDVGIAYLASGPVAGLLDGDQLTTITGAATGLQLGRHLVGGDFDGDGFADIVVEHLDRYDVDRSTGRGAAYLFFGPVSGALSTDEADLHWAGSYDWQDVGTTLANVGDVDGDGRDDLVVGAAGDHGRGPPDQGAWYLLAVDAP